MNGTFCDFKDTDTEFNGLKVYKCSYCGLTLALENIDKPMLCFKKMIDVKNVLNYSTNSVFMGFDPISPTMMDGKVYDMISSKFISESGIEPPKRYQEIVPTEQEPDTCTDEQVNARLAICTTCEHYKDNMCELCGCKIVRENNYMNKLSHKSASCPINKWGPIT